MRTLIFNGYIDSFSWFGDEITPEALHTMLYGDAGDLTDDVTILLNSGGGDCECATRMFDDIRAYPGQVTVRISGTAASAATVLAQAADRLEMTPGSLFMIHDPMTMAIGNEADMRGAIDVLQAVKKAIINCYRTRNQHSEKKISDMMTATTWMDANQALAEGFIDAITEKPAKEDAAVNSAENALRAVNRADAEKLVSKWIDRHKPQRVPPVAIQNEQPEDATNPNAWPDQPANDEPPAEPESKTDESAGKVSAETRRRKLALLH